MKYERKVLVLPVFSMYIMFISCVCFPKLSYYWLTPTHTRLSTCYLKFDIYLCGEKLRATYDITANIYVIIMLAQLTKLLCTYGYNTVQLSLWTNNTSYLPLCDHISLVCFHFTFCFSTCVFHSSRVDLIKQSKGHTLRIIRERERERVKRTNISSPFPVLCTPQLDE